MGGHVRGVPLQDTAYSSMQQEARTSQWRLSPPRRNRTAQLPATNKRFKEALHALDRLIVWSKCELNDLLERMLGVVPISSLAPQ
mgnify:CR=1 FL=1